MEFIKTKFVKVKEKTAKWWDEKGKHWVILAGICGISFALPFTVGYISGKKNGNVNVDKIREYLKNTYGDLDRGHFALFNENSEYLGGWHEIETEDGNGE